METSKLAIFQKAILGLVMLTILMVVLWIVLAKFVAWLSVVPNPVTSALIAFGGTVLAAAITVVYGKQLELKNAIEQHNRTQKLPAYEEFISILMSAMGKEGGFEEGELQEFFVRFTGKVMIWGSDDFIKEFASYRRASEDGNDLTAALHRTERLLFAVRREFGHHNKGLSQGDILRLFVNDYETGLDSLSTKNPSEPNQEPSEPD